MVAVGAYRLPELVALPKVKLVEDKVTAVSTPELVALPKVMPVEETRVVAMNVEACKLPVPVAFVNVNP